MNNINSIAKFANMLKEQSAKKNIHLYSDSESAYIKTGHSLKSCLPQDIIQSVSSQLRAIHKAESTICAKNEKKILEHYKTSDFITVDMLAYGENVAQDKAKFETQCVSDTQLINLVCGAEALVDSLTQEFDIPFYQAPVCETAQNNSPHVNASESKENVDNNKSVNIIKKELKWNNEKIFVPCKESNVDYDINETTELLNTEMPNTGATDENVTHLKTNVLNDNTQINNDSICVKFKDDNDEKLPSSPIFKSTPSMSCTPRTPLVYDLKKFESFEKIAHSVVENTKDIEVARNIINSQIIGKELHVEQQINSHFSRFDKNNLLISKKNKELDTYLKMDLDNIILNTTEKKFYGNIRALTEVEEEKNLFSSDDELENKVIKDLPLTCAIESSFYDQPDILNKTMFVGFQTASNKSIQICTDSFVQARNMLQNDENSTVVEPSLTELVKLCDSASKIIAEDDKTISDEKEIDNELHCNKPELIGSNRSSNIILQTENKYSINTSVEKCSETKINSVVSPARLDFGGFKTASNKVISLSKKALSRCNKVFQDIDLTEDFNKQADNSTNIHDSPVFKHVKENVSNLNDDMIQEFENIELVEKNVNENDEVGFKTASNKKTALFDVDMARIKNIFHDIDLSETLYKSDVEDDQQKCFKNINTAPKSIYKGFRTANNKIIDISEEAIGKTKSIFKDIELEDKFLCDNSHEKVVDKVCDVPSSKRVGFKTASNNVLCDNNQEKVVDKVFDVPSSKRVGFKTASNKDIRISEKSLVKTKDIFKDIEKYNPHPNGDAPILDDIKTPSNEIVNIEKEIKGNISDLNFDIQTVGTASDNVTDLYLKNLCGNDNNFFDPPSKRCFTKFKGFKTASNKEVEISAEAVQNSKKIFEDMVINDNISNAITKLHFQDHPSEVNKIQTTKGGNKIFDDFLVYRNNEAIIPKDITPGFHGFKTAGNKKIHISEKALTMSKKLLEDINYKENEVTNCNKNTASSKDVNISAEAFVESRKMFKDIAHKQNTDNNNIQICKYQLLTNAPERHSRDTKLGIGFKTANNKNMKISEEALIKTKKFLADLDGLEKNSTNKSEGIRDIKLVTSNKKLEITNNENSDTNIENIFDTQVANNFEMTLCTEDFLAPTPTRSKRSGSPILSCPKAKKRKAFLTPYKRDTNAIENAVEDVMIKTNENKIEFSNNYKKIKKFILKDIDKMEEQLQKEHDIENTELHIPNLHFEELLQYEFHSERNDFTGIKMSTQDIKQFFSDSVNKNIIPEGWIENHMRLIMWKCFSYEVKFPKTMKGVCTVRNVIDQLKYRYDKELCNVERPPLRKILEKDDVSTRNIVLCVIQIYENGEKVQSVANASNSIEFLLTDGWYCLKACGDKMLSQLACDGKIYVGMKLMIHGAELLNCEQGMSPWEDTSSVRLKLSGNSTRRARWFARLGYHGNGAALTPLSSVRVDGGKVSRLRLLVTRTYPALYVEKLQSGSTVTRSERLEHIYQMQYEADRQQAMEKLYEDMEKESSGDSQDSDVVDVGLKRNCSASGSQLAKMVKKSLDTEFEVALTSSQAVLLQEHERKRRQKLLDRMQSRMQETFGVRNVVQLVKVRVAGIGGQDGADVTKGMLSIWRPNDAILDIVQEGEWIDVFNVLPTAVRYAEIQLSAGRQTLFVKPRQKFTEKFKPFVAHLKRTSYPIKRLVQNPLSNTDYNEIDTAGMIFLIDPSYEDFNPAQHQFQNVYLTDADKNIVCLNFWGGVKKFGFENALDTGQIFACINLQKRAGNTKRNIPHYRVTEFSYFTKIPKYNNCRLIIDELRVKFGNIDKNKFIEDCVAIKNNYSTLRQQNNENISPYRFINADMNLSKNKVFIESPLVKKMEEFNLSGLDFESTFKQKDTQQMSPELLLRKKRVNEKIAKLKLYGEPPPLSSIHIINKSKHVTSSFKSPLCQKSNVASVDKSNTPKYHGPQNVAINGNPSLEINTPKNNDLVIPNNDFQCSPILSNTKRSTIKPTKLNFCDKNDSENIIDTDSEEFDYSPPLSYD